MGDSAHPFLPTSVQGASQAIEDGVTIATVLKLAGSSSEVPTALLAYENIRYIPPPPPQKKLPPNPSPNHSSHLVCISDPHHLVCIPDPHAPIPISARLRVFMLRWSEIDFSYEHVCQAQETGKHIREMWHKTDLYAEEFSPESIKMPFRPWIFENDAENVAIQKVPPYPLIPPARPSRPLNCVFSTTHSHGLLPFPSVVLSPPLSFRVLKHTWGVIYICAFELVG